MCQLIKLFRKNQSFIQFTQHIWAECLLCAKLCSRCSVWDYGNETWPYYSRDIREVTWTSCESPGEGGSSMSTPSTGQWKSQIFSFPARKVRLPGVKIAKYGMSSVKNEIAAKEEQEGEWWIQGLFTAEQVFRRQQEEKVAGRKQVGKESTWERTGHVFGIGPNVAGGKGTWSGGCEIRDEKAVEGGPSLPWVDEMRTSGKKDT